MNFVSEGYCKSRLVALLPCGLIALDFLLFLPIIRHYTHPGSTGPCKLLRLLIDCIL